MANPFTASVAPPSMVQQLVAPDIAVRQQQLLRNQQMADLLRQNALAPPTDTQMIGGWAIKKSPFEALGKLAQGLAANYSQSRGVSESLVLARQYSGKLAEMLNGGQGSQTQPQTTAPMPGQMGSGMVDAANPDIAPPSETSSTLVSTPANQPLIPPTAPQPAQSGGFQNQGDKAFQIGNLLRGSIIGQVGGEHAGAAYWDQFKATDPTRLAMAAGLNPQQAQQANADQLTKLNYIAPVNARPGTILRDPKTNMQLAFNPQIPEGATPQFDASGNVVGMSPIAGASTAISALSSAKKAGENQQTVAPKDLLPTNPDGTVTPRTIAQTIGAPQSGISALEAKTAANANIAGITIKPSTQNDLAEITQEISKQKNPTMLALLNAEKDRISASLNGQPASQAPAATTGVGAPFGAEKGATNAQDELSKSYQAQKDAHQNAQTTNSYLDNIVQLSKKAAVGPQTDKLQFANGLLSLVGNEKATDAVTANNLLDKYSNQIVARLGGSGGNASDAGRAILTSAYPNAKMNAAAIEEAAANIKGANNMMMARTNIVAPHADKRDPVTYNESARKFDQNADPRIFQYAKMTPDQRTQFRSTLQPAQMQDFASRIRNLEKLGVKF